jgi:hypothetical protein
MTLQLYQGYLIQGGHVLQVLFRRVQISFRLIDFYGHLFDGSAVPMIDSGLGNAPSSTVGYFTVFPALLTHFEQNPDCVAQGPLSEGYQIARKIH